MCKYSLSFHLAHLVQQAKLDKHEERIMKHSLTAKKLDPTFTVSIAENLTSKKHHRLGNWKMSD